MVSRMDCMVAARAEDVGRAGSHDNGESDAVNTDDHGEREGAGV